MVQLGVRSGVLRKLRAGNLMVSNVPGPDFPLYFAGMELRAVYPLGPVIDGVALNITVQSYRESLFVGINACASAVPDLPGLTRAMVDELSLLCRMAAGAGEPHRADPGPLRPPATSRRPRRAPSAGWARRRRSEPAAGPGTGAAGAGRWRRVAAVGQGGAVERSDLEGNPVVVAPWLLEQGAGPRASGPGASSRSRPTTGPTTRRRTPTGA